METCFSNAPLTRDFGKTVIDGPRFDRVGLSEGAVSIAGVRVSALAEKYGTPLYVMDAGELRSQIQRLKTAFQAPAFKLYYSVKANPSLRVLRTALDESLGLDLCSPGDLYLSERAGAKSSSLTWTGVGLTESLMREIRSRGIWLNLDSESEAGLWTRCGGGPVGLRVAVDLAAGFHEHCRSGAWGGKFGIAQDRVLPIAAELREQDSPVEVLHSHMGSSISDESAYLAAMDRLLCIAAEVPSVRSINLGGGLGEPFHPDDRPFPLAILRDGLLGLRRDFESSTGRQIEIALEPGEFIASTAGYLVTRVLTVKHWQRQNESRVCAIVDGGANDHPAHAFYGSYLHIYVDGKAPNDDLAELQDQPHTVYGCTNQTGDTLAANRVLPMLETNDLLVVRNAGSYAWCRSTRFNERPRPAEIWVLDGNHEIGRCAETMEDLLSGQ